MSRRGSKIALAGEGLRAGAWVKGGSEQRPLTAHTQHTPYPGIDVQAAWLGKGHAGGGLQ